ncbi:MAG: adenylosuccinate lyase [Firmicutes bacterium]|nr:adenylosuccinate lyase [Bacillota bacterium]
MIARYSLPDMQALWTLENKFRHWLNIEIYACEAWAELGVIPREDVELIKQKASFTVERVLEIEKETRHDVVAFTRCVAESLGPESKWIHYGLTSTDVVDTALSAILVQALDIIIDDVKKLLVELRRQAQEHKYTVMMGRTHGVHAEPTTFGLKMALYVAEMERNLKRLEQARENIAYGKLSGAVGTYANIDPFVEEYVCTRMGLKPAPIATQTLQRDRHAEVLSTLAIVAGTLEKLATEVRGLQKTETREVEEPFRTGQKGSSAMPHKRNPILCERVSGLSRVVRGYAAAGFENMALWHERDISHSSVERIILPDATLAVHYMLHLMTRVIRDLQVYPENMRRNMQVTHGLVFSQRVLLELIERGMTREQAYDLVQMHAMEAWETCSDFLELLLRDREIGRVLPENDLRACFDLSYHLTGVDKVFARLGL